MKELNAQNTQICQVEEDHFEEFARIAIRTPKRRDVPVLLNLDHGVFAKMRGVPDGDWTCIERRR